MEFEIGQVVISKAGRDKGECFVVFDVQGEFLQLVDGKRRRAANPKKKKTKHIQPTNTVDTILKEAILGQKYLKDSDFRSVLDDFKA